MLEQVTIADALVTRDRDYPHRWIDARGKNVARFEINGPIANGDHRMVEMLPD